MSNSQSTPNGGIPSHHVVSFDTYQLWRDMEVKVRKLPGMLSSSAGKKSCCIFRVPRNLVEINERAYQPHVVSIGPYHHGQSPGFQMIEEHKWRFLNDLLARTNKTLKDLIDCIAELEKEIRESYSETIEIDGKKLVEIMVLDGCFILELLRKVEKVVSCDQNDPFLRMAWVLPFIMRDLLRLENQIPYFVLEILFDLTVENPTNSDQPASLTELSLKFFNHLMCRPENALEKFNQAPAKDEHHLHLLHPILLTYSPTDDVQRYYLKTEKYLKLILSATKLRLSGIKFRPTSSDKTESRLLDIKFGSGTLEIPKLMIDDFWTSLILNFIAFEQCYGHCRKHITHYCTFLGCLLGDPGDVALLREKNIVENYYGTDEEVVGFFSNMQKDVVLDIDTSYLSKVFIDVNEYCDSWWHLRQAGFKYRYCDAPWKVISLLAASVLLVFTIAGTIFTGLQYWKPRQ